MKKNNLLKIIIVLALSLILIAGCQQIPTQPPIQQPTQTGTALTPPTTQTINTTPGNYTEQTFNPDQKITTNNFKTTEELQNFIKQNAAGNNYYANGGYTGGIMMKGGARELATADSSMAVAAPTAAPAVQVNSNAGGYSTTNVQVQNVDEGDIIKTDGTYIYTISDTVLYIIKAYPGEEAEVVSTIKLDGTPQDILIQGDYVAVFGNYYNENYFTKINFRPINGMTFYNIYNVQDKKNPKLEKEYKFEGQYFKSRMTNGYAYLLTTSGMQYRPEPMPLMWEGDVKTAMPVDRIYYYPIPYNNPIFVNIHAINMQDLSKPVSSEAIAVEGSQDLYMSEKNIYITYTEYINEYQIQQQITMEFLDPKLSDTDKQLIAKIKATDNDVLSNSEKESKIYQVYQNFAAYMTQDEQQKLQDQVDEELKNRLDKLKYMEFTVINKISIDQDKITPIANGKVPGNLNNQFAMDEKDDVLRIATTLSPRWSMYGQQTTQSTNNVYALDSNLNQLSELTDLAKGETIYSTRFMGDRLYMVTFAQIDPFFAIDLSDPKNIKELGKLKIPGFSQYLHPYDNDTIIGIGKQASATGRTGGLKISLFDVSDVSNPKEIDTYVTDSRYAESSVLYEHRAFLFSKDKELLVIPGYNYNYQDKTENYNGAFVFKINKQEITLRGLIDHSQGRTDQYYQPLVERSLYINDLLYTKSPDLLRINKIEDLSKVKNVDLNYTNPKIPIY